MVYAIIYEFMSDEKREVMRKLGGIQVAGSAYLVDVSDRAAPTVYSSIVAAIVAETGLMEDQVFDDGERLYVIPVERGVAGRGGALVDGWVGRRGLLRSVGAETEAN